MERKINSFKKIVKTRDRVNTMPEESSRFDEETNSQEDDESYFISLMEQQKFNKVLEQKSKVFNLLNTENLSYVTNVVSFDK